LKEAFLTVGMLLLFTMGAGAAITPPALQQLLVAEVISTIIAFVGGALVMRNR